MKIFEIIPSLVSGGGERFVVDLCNELSKEHDVTLVVLHKLEGVCAFYKAQVSTRVRIISLNKRSGLDPILFIKIFRLVKKEKPDIIHTHLKGILYSFFALLFLVPGVHTIHSEASKEASDKLSNFVRKILYKKHRVIPVTISQATQDSFQEFYGKDAFRIDNGRDIPADLLVSQDVHKELNNNKPNGHIRKIVHLAHFDDNKRQDLMARVAKRLYDEGYEFSLFFIGRWDDEEFKRKVEDIMPPCCHILGQRTNPLEYLKEAGAYGLCSRYEGFPISLIEAIGVGAIPICTPVGGIVNVIKDSFNGILSVDSSEDAYYSAMKRYLELTDKQLDIMKSNTIKSYQPYTMKICASKYVKLFKQIEGENKGH